MSADEEPKDTGETPGKTLFTSLMTLDTIVRIVLVVVIVLFALSA